MDILFPPFASIILAMCQDITNVNLVPIIGCYDNIERLTDYGVLARPIRAKPEADEELRELRRVFTRLAGK